MPQIIEDIVRKSRSKFDFSYLSDGKARRFSKGVDFTTKKHVFCQNIRHFARKAGMKMITDNLYSNTDWFDVQLVQKKK